MSETTTPERSARLRRWATTASLCFAVTLIVLKAAAWIATGSMTLLTSVIDSVVDAAGSAVSFVGVRYAMRPADHMHRFGHGKAEALAAFVQAVFLVGAAVALGFQSAQRLFSPQPLAALEIGIGVAVISIAATACLVLFQTYVVRETGSAAIAADKAHYASDFLINLAVLAAFGLTALTGSYRFDPLFGLSIAAYMGWNSRGIANEALRMLLDQELASGKRARIAEVINAHPDARGLHDLRTRDAGDRIFVEFHLEVDPDLSVRRGHEIVDETERAVAALFPNAEVSGHLEPAGIADQRFDALLSAPPPASGPN